MAAEVLRLHGLTPDAHALSLADARRRCPPRSPGRAYDPARVAVGIVHLGLGAFHRAHQAVYTDDVLARDPRWGICGVSLKTPRAIEPLAAQDGLYTLLTKGSDGTAARVIGSVRETLFAGADRAALVARFADPRIAIVTRDGHREGLLPRSRDRRAQPRAPGHRATTSRIRTRRSRRSGILAAGLAARRAAGAGPLTFVCCDNLPHNGRMVEGLVRAFARAAIRRWRTGSARNVAFPVHDGRPHRARRRPTPTSPKPSALLGVHDAAPVAAEAVRPVGHRGSLRRRRAPRGRRPARNSWPTSRRSRR